MTACRLPLLELDDPDAPLIWLRGEPISRGRFAAGVLALAQRLPAGRDVVNRCSTRYGFCTVLVAAALRGRTCLLPGSERLPPALSERSAETCVASDDPDSPCDVCVPTQPPARACDRLEAIPADHPLAVVFTSGSTGQPQAHVKTWHSLWHAGQQISQSLLQRLAPACIVATVPMHHMYGLEASVILPLACAHSVTDARPAFPDDVRSVLAAVHAPRVLVTTPVHLRTLLSARVRLPELARIISATAPLPADLATAAEAAFGAPVHEIYGCTEAGSMATRRSIDGPLWTPLHGIHLTLQDDDRGLACGEHLDAPVPLHDLLQLEPDDSGRFRLIGRSSDMVKVGGKRASLSDLTHKLLSIPGVVDGIVFQPDSDDQDRVLQRLAALVVAPDLNENQILSALSQMIDPVFLPRPLRRIGDLPRNGTGKLPRDTLQQLLSHA